MMRDISCPYLNCEKTPDASERGVLTDCGGCGGAVLHCPSCGAGNRIWAAFCRACGTQISERKRIIEQESLPFLEGWKKSRGLFLSRMIENSRKPEWRGKISVVDGSVLVFDGGPDYPRLFLIHPLLDRDPLPLHPFQSGPGEEKLSGASIITDRHLFLGSKRFLFQIDLPSISTAQTYRLDLHRKAFKAGCEEMVFLSQDLLLLGERLEGDELRFTIWDIAGCAAADRMETRGRFFSAATGRLVAASEEGVRIFTIDEERKRFDPEAITLQTGGRAPVSRPVLIEGRLYLIVSQPNGEENSLLKWVMNGAGEIEQDARVLRRGYYYDMLALPGNSYALTSIGGATIWDATLDREQHRFPQAYGMYPPAPVCGFGPLLALPYMNSPNSISVAVVNGTNGHHVFTTEPFREMLSGPVLWRRFLFILGRRAEGEAAGVYGYDLS